VNTVTITKDEYNELVHAEEVLDALYAAGVDNWDGYEEAMNNVGIEED